MPSVEHAAILDRDADNVRNIVKRFGAIADWHPAITEGRIEGDVPDGTPGCVRVLRLADGGVLRERLLAVDEAMVELEIDGVSVKIGRGADAGVIAAVINALKVSR